MHIAERCGELCHNAGQTRENAVIVNWINDDGKGHIFDSTMMIFIIPNAEGKNCLHLSMLSFVSKYCRSNQFFDPSFAYILEMMNQARYISGLSDYGELFEWFEKHSVIL